MISMKQYKYCLSTLFHIIPMLKVKQHKHELSNSGNTELEFGFGHCTDRGYHFNIYSINPAHLVSTSELYTWEFC